MKVRAVCLIGAALLALAAAGCEKDEPELPIAAESTTTTDSDPDGPLLVGYTRTGGVAGINEQLGVNEDGAATLELGQGDQLTSSAFELTPSELDRLTRALDDAELEPGAAPQTGCADCFVYEIAYTGRSSSFDQTQVPPGAQQLVDVLEQLVEDNIPARAAPG